MNVTWGAAGLVVGLWASAFVVTKIALREIGPLELALLRYLVAAAAFALLTVVRPVARARRRDLPRLLVLGAIGIAAYNILLNFGQRHVSAGIASILINTVPILTSLLSVGFLRERIGGYGWLGTGVAFIGVMLIGLERGGWTGVDGGTLLVLGAALSQAIYFVLARPLLRRYRPIDLTSYVAWFGCLFLLPVGGGLGATLQSIEPRTLGAVLFLGLGPAALAYAAWSHVLTRVEPGQASNILFLVPVVALALGWWVLGEIASPAALLGGALAVTGLLIRRKSRW